MGILKKMLGMKIFLILCLSVLSYSRPQPEFKIIIHFHPEPYQPPPARGGPVGVGRIDSPAPRPVGVGPAEPRRMGGAPFARESGFDYSDDEEETEDEAVTPK